MRLWQSGFMHPVSTGNYGGSNPPGRASARSFNGRTLDFGPNYECSIHSLAAKFWCGVIQRQDGLLIRAPPGFDSQRRNHACDCVSEPRPLGSGCKGLWLNGEALDF
jgi:hypothetical protein